MSRGVDVLAFFDDLTHYLSGQDDLAGYEIEQTEAARAAVAELIEALDGLEQAYCRAGSPLSRDERFEDRKRLIAARAAIARARGAE